MLKSLRYLAIIGNILFALWVLFNGMDEGWKATPMQSVSYIALLTLLALNSYLVYRKQNN